MGREILSMLFEEMLPNTVSLHRAIRTLATGNSLRPVMLLVVLGQTE